MAPAPYKKRKIEDGVRKRPSKKPRKFKRQLDYHSSSDDDENPRDRNVVKNVEDASAQTPDANGAAESGDSAVEDASAEENGVQSDGDAIEPTDASSASDPSDSEASETSRGPSKKRKRNDPDAFATSMSKILSSKLTTSKRADPVLSRSKEASEVSKEMIDARLETKARHKLREEKKAALDRGRVKDVMGTESMDVSSAAVQEQERRLRKTAQRGVVKLFNAVRAAQVKGEEAAREARKTGTVGIVKREERVNEMSKKGFLDLIAGGGKKASGTVAQETI
ncbi:Rrp15p-domain-containing protein [Cryomyces antarcticus]